MAGYYNEITGEYVDLGGTDPLDFGSVAGYDQLDNTSGTNIDSMAGYTFKDGVWTSPQGLTFDTKTNTGSLADLFKNGGIGSVLGIAGAAGLAQQLMGGGGSSGYAGYQGGIPRYTAERTQYALPVVPLSPANQARVTDEGIKSILGQEGFTPDRAARTMYKYGISPERVAKVFDVPVSGVQEAYSKALGPNQGLLGGMYGKYDETTHPARGPITGARDMDYGYRRPGSGGITYFSPTTYKPVPPVTQPTTAPTTVPTTVATEPTTQPTVIAAGGGMMHSGIASLAGGGETVDQWAARQPDLSNVVDPMERKNALESWQMQRPGYVNPINYDTYEQYAGAANIKDEGGGSGQDLTNRSNFYGMTTENYQNALKGDATNPMGQYQSVYGSELLSPIEQIAAQTARAQGIGTMSPQVAALAKENPNVFNAASEKYQNYFTNTYPGSLEYQSVLSGPMQFSSSGVKMPEINSSASMYIIDKTTGKIIKNPNYKKKMADGGIANLGGYSDGGQLLRGPGDGVSDDIPATIGGKQPARLADGEFVVPARIVSELGNGSTEAGARKLYAMMDRIKKARSKAKNIAANTKADKHLPA